MVMSDKKVAEGRLEKFNLPAFPPMRPSTGLDTARRVGNTDQVRCA